MRLLVSVADAMEARAALDGGADVIDAKDPTRGALGAVDGAALRAIAAVVGGARPMSAALGDARSASEVEGAARDAASARIAYVKVGFAGTDDDARVEALLRAAVRGVRSAGGDAEVVAVAYADAVRVGAVSPSRIVDIAARAGAMGVLLDTARKDGGALFDVMREDAVADWVGAAHAASLVVALAGGLAGGDLSVARSLGADIAGVRTAACDGGRTGRVSRERVAALAAMAGRSEETRSPGDRIGAPAGSAAITPRAALR